MTKKLFGTVVIAAFILVIGCGQNTDSPEADKTSTKTENGLSAFEVENGIGPVDAKLQLGALDKTLAASGEKIFVEKCSACHKLDERYVGPAQRDILQRRTPEYVINMILNPDEMLKRHPEAKKMLAEYLTPMTNQNISMDDARALLEYFRSLNK
jgi:mono/diheme cytochrome c family protein